MSSMQSNQHILRGKTLRAAISKLKEGDCVLLKIAEAADPHFIIEKIVIVHSVDPSFDSAIVSTTNDSGSPMTLRLPEKGFLIYHLGSFNLSDSSPAASAELASKRRSEPQKEFLSLSSSCRQGSPTHNSSAANSGSRNHVETAFNESTPRVTYTTTYRFPTALTGFSGNGSHPVSHFVQAVPATTASTSSNSVLNVNVSRSARSRSQDILRNYAGNKRLGYSRAYQRMAKEWRSTSQERHRRSTPRPNVDRMGQLNYLLTGAHNRSTNPVYRGQQSTHSILNPSFSSSWHSKSFTPRSRSNCADFSRSSNRNWVSKFDELINIRHPSSVPEHMKTATESIPYYDTSCVDQSVGSSRASNYVVVERMSPVPNGEVHYKVSDAKGVSNAKGGYITADYTTVMDTPASSEHFTGKHWTDQFETLKKNSPFMLK